MLGCIQLLNVTWGQDLQVAPPNWGNPTDWLTLDRELCVFQVKDMPFLPTLILKTFMQREKKDT